MFRYEIRCFACPVDRPSWCGRTPETRTQGNHYGGHLRLLRDPEGGDGCWCTGPWGYSTELTQRHGPRKGPLHVRYSYSKQTSWVHVAINYSGVEVEGFSYIYCQDCCVIFHGPKVEPNMACFLLEILQSDLNLQTFISTLKLLWWSKYM